VTADTASGSDWLVTSGLKAGDRVIVAGSQKTRTGSLVKPVESPGTSGTSATPATADNTSAAHS
jgi:membrane fusion protein (multidrug efflux system)